MLWSLHNEINRVDFANVSGGGGGGGESNVSCRSWSPHGSLCTTPLAEESGGADRLRYWDEAQSLTVERWKAAHVLAWMEFGLGMAAYLPACTENIKSGKVNHHQLNEINEPAIVPADI